MDNDAKMLELLGSTLTNVQVEYRAAKLAERTKLRPELEKLLKRYAEFQLKLLEDGVITTKADLEEMETIREEINAAAKKQKLAVAIVKTAAFVASRLA